MRVVHYDPNTGVFRWQSRPDKPAEINTRWAGKICSPNATRSGYRIIKIDRGQYYAHRLAWLYVYGEWPRPPHEIDHIDQDKSNNAITNLRMATREQNKWNVREVANNTSGHRGVTFFKNTGEWQARISVGKKSRHLGFFRTREEACAARKTAELIYYGQYSPSEGIHPPRVR